MNEGMKRLENNQIDSVADQTRSWLQRGASKTHKALQACDYKRLTAEEKARHCAKMAFVGAVKLFAKPKSMKMLEGSEAVTASKKFDRNATLALFQKKKKPEPEETI